MSELTTLFQNTADAIRSKTGDTATMKASQFPAKIQGISVGISQDEADARYLQLSGGTMTGDLILSGAPTADNQAATKAYVDDKLGDGNLVADIPNAVYGTYGNIEIPIPNTVDLTRDFILEMTTRGYITSGSISDNAYLGMCGTYDKGTSRAEMVFLVGNQGSSQQTLKASTIKARFTACGYHCVSGSIDEHLFVSAGRIFAINSSKNLIIGFKHASGYGINIAIKIYQ